MSCSADGISREILLIEDNPGDVRLIREALKDRCVNLRVVRDGEQALRCLNRDGAFPDAPRPDLILLDLNLPRLSGREVLAALKAHPAYRCIPVIVITSSHAPDDVHFAYENHANGYVVKPPDVNDFFRAMAGLEMFWLRIAQLPTGEQHEPRNTS